MQHLWQVRQGLRCFTSDVCLCAVCLLQFHCHMMTALVLQLMADGVQTFRQAFVHISQLGLEPASELLEQWQKMVSQAVYI